MSAASDLFKELGITYIGAGRYVLEPLHTCCLPFVDILISKHGVPHTRLVLRTITETSRANARMLIADVIQAVSDVILRHPRWTNFGWLEAFDKIDLSEMRKTAKATKLRPWASVLATLICLRLTELLGPSVLPKPPRVKKVPKSLVESGRKRAEWITEIENRIQIGLQLIDLRSTVKSNADFGDLRRKHFPDLNNYDASEWMKVARLYGNRPEIFRRTTWGNLSLLASPSFPKAQRLRMESDIIAGKKVEASDVKRARSLRPTRTAQARSRPWCQSNALGGRTSSLKRRSCVQ